MKSAVVVAPAPVVNRAACIYSTLCVQKTVFLSSFSSVYAVSPSPNFALWPSLNAKTPAAFQTPFIAARASE